MIKRIYPAFIILLISIQLNASNNPNWGVTGHRTAGAIAEKHLTKKAKKQIRKLLQGESLALVSTFGDEIKSDSRYAKLYTWHYVNFPFNTEYKDSDKNPDGDIITGINFCIDILKSPNASKEDKIFYLKFLVHLIGDLHQPLHVGKGEDQGGNDIKVKWHYRNSNLHRVWDSEMIETWNMSYTELSSNTKSLNSEQIKKIQNGTVLEWANESQKLAQIVYKSAKAGDKLSYRYSYDHFATVRTQLQKAGIRLAKILNDIFN